MRRSPSPPAQACNAPHAAPHTLAQIKAVKVGAAGFATGMSVGRALIEEQTSLLGGVLASMNSLLGSPYAELLWCQAVGALLVGMVSELVYCGVLVSAACMLCRLGVDVGACVTVYSQTRTLRSSGWLGVWPRCTLEPT